MPVTIKLPNVRAQSVSDRDSVQGPLALLEGACKPEYQECSELLQSSFSDFTQTIIPSPNGFVLGAIEAYNNHHHLQLRPEDIWFAILSQLRFHFSQNKEQKRYQYVTHGGKEELIMESDALDHRDLDSEQFIRFMSHEMDKYTWNTRLQDWAMPEFTTTTEQDKVVASVLLMGSLQYYFGYTCYSHCGLPSVTLLGEKTDWEEILRRLDKIEMLVYEMLEFGDRLKPIITRFILSFENPDSDQVRSFWNQIAHTCDMGSGPVYYSGWISAFCFWNLDGTKIKYLEHNPNIESSSGRTRNPQEPLSLDGVVYNAINSNDIPPGYMSMPIKIVVSGTTHDAVIVAGSVGLKCTKSTAMQQHEDTLSAETGCWIYEKKPDEDTAKEKSLEPAARDSVPGS